MKLLFEINTTFSETIFVSIDKNITLCDFHKTAGAFAHHQPDPCALLP